MGNSTVDELEAEYSSLLKDRINDLKGSTNAVSRLEDDSHLQVNMESARQDLHEFRDEFAEMQHKLRGNEKVNGHRSYPEILSAMQRGEYRR